MALTMSVKPCMHIPVTIKYNNTSEVTFILQGVCVHLEFPYDELLN